MGQDPAPRFALVDDGTVLQVTHACVIDVARVVCRLPIRASWWQVLQERPLTVIPSIRCLACGMHGFVTDGEWRPV